jgi:hypothetical protein
VFSGCGVDRDDVQGAIGPRMGGQPFGDHGTPFFFGHGWCLEGPSTDVTVEFRSIHCAWSHGKGAFEPLEETRVRGNLASLPGRVDLALEEVCQR